MSSGPATTGFAAISLMPTEELSTDLPAPPARKAAGEALPALEAAGTPRGSGGRRAAAGGRGSASPRWSRSGAPVGSQAHLPGRRGGAGAAADPSDLPGGAPAAEGGSRSRPAGRDGAAAGGDREHGGALCPTGPYRGGARRVPHPAGPTAERQPAGRADPGAGAAAGQAGCRRLSYRGAGHRRRIGRVVLPRPGRAPVRAAGAGRPGGGRRRRAHPTGPRSAVAERDLRRGACGRRSRRGPPEPSAARPRRTPFPSTSSSAADRAARPPPGRGRPCPPRTTWTSSSTG